MILFYFLFMEQNIKLMEEIISKSMGNEECVEVQPQSCLHTSD